MSIDTVHDLAEDTGATLSTPERLRMLADWYEQHPNAVAPALERIHHACWSAEGVAKAANTLGGQWEKSVSENYFYLSREILPGLRYEVFAPRDSVCTKRVLGTEKVMEPDPDAPLVEVEREIVEWDCAPSILALTSEEGRPATAMAGARGQTAVGR